MAHNQNRRNAVRVQLKPTLDGALSRFPVTLADISTTGARLQHDNPLMFQPGKRFVLEFVCDGEQFRLTCTVARSRMETNPSTRRLTYTTGVRFVELDEFTVARLWAVIAYPTSTTNEASLGFEILSH
jgi:hypothetical protein